MKRISAVLLALALTMAAGAAMAVEAEEVMAKNGMVSSAHVLASQAGVEIMQKGGQRR